MPLIIASGAVGRSELEYNGKRPPYAPDRVKKSDDEVAKPTVGARDFIVLRSF